MVNINLTTSDERQKAKSPLKTNIIYGLIVVIICLVVYGLLAAGNLILEKRTLTVRTQKLEKERSIGESSNKDIFDFQTRLAAADSLVGRKNYALESLGRLQEVIINGAYLSAFEYNEKSGTLKLTIETNSYNNVAKQVFNFKKSEYFSNVEIPEVTSKEGKISFIVKATINKSVK